MSHLYVSVLYNCIRMHACIVPARACLRSLSRSSAMARIQSLKDKATLILFIKAHIKEAPSKSTYAWEGCDMDRIVGNYEDFLYAIANTEHRLETMVLQQALKDTWECDAATLRKFGKVLSEALSYCREKGRFVSTGAKLHPSVLRVAKAYSSKSPSPREKACDSAQSLQEDSSVEVQGGEDEAASAAAKAFAQAEAMFPRSSGSLAELARKTPLKRTISIVSSEAPSPEKNKKKVGALTWHAHDRALRDEAHSLIFTFR